jgi:hypothetical protein
MVTRHKPREPRVTTNRSYLPPTGMWIIDPTDTIISFAWRRLRLWTRTSRRHALGIIHLDELPPVGVIRFQQPSGLPVLTMALDPVSVETGAADLDVLLGGPDTCDVLESRWWTLQGESLSILPTGTLRVMATLTAGGVAGLVELRFQVDPKGSRQDRLVLRGRGVLDRRAFGRGKRARVFDPKIQLDLVVHATPVEIDPSTEEPDLHTQRAYCPTGATMSDSHAHLQPQSPQGRSARRGPGLRDEPAC